MITYRDFEVAPENFVDHPQNFRTKLDWESSYQEFVENGPRVKPILIDPECKELADFIKDLKPGFYMTVRGHRRGRIASAIRAQDPIAFKKHWPSQKYQVQLVSCTPKELIGIMLDDTDYKPLQTAREGRKAVIALIHAGYSEREIIIRCEGLILRCFGSKQTDKWKKLQILKREGKMVDYWAGLVAYRHGMYQNIKNLADCPTIVDAADEYWETGRTLAALGKLRGEEVPKLNNTIISTLRIAHDKDMEVRDSKGQLKYSKIKPGPMFMDLWRGLIAERAGDKEDGTSIPEKKKVMSKVKLEEMEKTVNSKGIRSVIRKVLGSKSDLNDLDRGLCHWEALQRSGEKVDQEMVAQVHKRGAVLLAHEAEDTPEENIPFTKVGE